MTNCPDLGRSIGRSRVAADCRRRWSSRPDVWICPYPNGHLLATGLDAAGRRQYLYHEAWRAQRDREKHDHVQEFAARLPAARDQASGQLAGRGLGRDATHGPFEAAVLRHLAG